MQEELLTRGELSFAVNPAWTHLEWLQHGFTTRMGGVSSGVFKSLNLGLHTEDQKENVLQNRVRLAEVLDLNAGDFICACQVHGKRVAVVGREHRGRGAKDYSNSLPDTDGLLTGEAEAPLLSFYADCVPIMIVDRKRRAAGMAHAGWKGTLFRIGAELVSTFFCNFGSSTGDLEAWIGPSIGDCCYEVDCQVSDPFRQEFDFFDDIYQDSSGSRGYLNLKEANRRILLAAGLKEEAIFVSSLCTSCEEELFFSYRRDGHCGRMGAFINIRKDR